MADTIKLRKHRVKGRVRWDLEIGDGTTCYGGEIHKYFGFDPLRKVDMWQGLWKFRAKESCGGGVYFTREKDGLRAIEEYFNPLQLMRKMQVK